MTSRAPKATDFVVPVEGVGTFTFGRRVMADQFRIAAEFSRICDGVKEPNEFLQSYGGYAAVLKVMTVKAPDGWDIDNMDPFDDESFGKLVRVYVALMAKEDSFRPKLVSESKGERPSVGGDAAVSISPQVQPAAQ